jgi:glycosyltransferase involved in cell wall biosynthesis
VASGFPDGERIRGNAKSKGTVATVGTIYDSALNPSKKLGEAVKFNPLANGYLPSSWVKMSPLGTRHAPINVGDGLPIVRDISVIFPAFNEEANIRCTIEAAIKVLPKVARRWEIIVVNDGSTDDTALVCDQLRALYSEVKVIVHQQNRGYGAALKSGITSANYDLIFFSDSDGQFDFNELQQLICWSEDFDIIAGYRAKRRDPLHRRLNALGWNVLIRLVLGIKIRDIDCAFKLFRRSVFDHIQIRCVGAMVNTEILAQATRLGLRIRQVKVSHFPRRYGKQSGANLRVIIKAFRELCRLWRKLRRVKPDQAGLQFRRRRTFEPPNVSKPVRKQSSDTTQILQP